MTIQGIFSYEILYITCIFTVKTSILLFYRRIFPVRAARIVIYSVLGFICVYTIAALNIIVFQCRPIRYFWDRASIPGMCMDEIRAIIGLSIPNICTDFIILIIPLPLVWRLRIPRAQKLAVTGAFLLGGLYVWPWTRCGLRQRTWLTSSQCVHRERRTSHICHGEQAYGSNMYVSSTGLPIAIWASDNVVL